MLPFGGGNETSYQKFHPHLENFIRPFTPDAPGKGRRIKEPVLKNIHLITEEYYRQIAGIVKAPYAIFGHSMGAYNAHLLIHKLIENNHPLPVHVFISSKVAPSLNYNKKRTLYTNEEFIRHLRDLKGMPDAILENDELLTIFLPTVRADFEAIDNYKYQKKTPYAVPMSVMAGTGENVPDETLSDWEKETSAGITFFRRYEGDHFWLFDHIETVCQHINETLRPFASL